MQFACPYCNKVMQIEPDQRGQIVDCCHCGAMVEIPYRIPGSSLDNHLRLLNKSSAEQSTTKDENTSIYFILGFLFSLLGLLIAAIAGGSKGCRAAWNGLLWSFLVYLLVCIIGLLITVALR